MARFAIRVARRHAVLTALLLVAFAIALPGGAAAHHSGVGDAIETVTTTEWIGGELVEVNRHPDPLDRLASGEADLGSVAPDDTATPRSLAQSCATVNRATDDTGNAYQPSSSSVIKVIYAYPTNIGNRLSTYAPVIQTGIRWVDELTAGESGNTKALRFDLGTSAGPGCVDIQAIPLQLSSSAYTAVPSQTFNQLRTELLPRIAGQPGVRNYLVYADGIAVPNVGGEAQVLSDESVAGNLHRLGGLWGMLYGRSGSDFFGSQTSFAPGTTSRLHVDLALHEISHTLGAVQRSAPHHSASWHCLDEWDVLCYDDDGSGGQSTYVACNTPSSQYWDCNRDDYFSAAPAPGSYLATHWNVFNSVFMCPVSQCAPGGVSGPPSIASSPPPPSAPESAAPSGRRSPPALRKCRKAKRRAAAARRTCRKKKKVSAGRPGGR